MESLLGKTLGQYQLISELGRGGMAVVYKAYQPALQRFVAIKVLPPQLSLDPDFAGRFQHEAVAAARLKHPNIVTIHDVGTSNGMNYIVMELVEGESLAAVIRREGAMRPERVTNIVAQVASALDYAHAQNFIHRDIKPSNIMLGADDHATLMDFGIAKAMSGTRLTQSGTIIGTPEYMSPEQVRGVPVDHRADIYSLGIVAYEMLAGQVPFSGDTASVLYKQAHELPPPIRSRAVNVPTVIARSLDCVLAKNPSERFPSAGAFARALVGAEPMAVLPPTQPLPHVQPGSSSRVNRPVWIIAALGGIIALALICIVAVNVVTTVGSIVKKPTPTVVSSTPAPTFTQTSIPSTVSPPNVSSTPAATPTPTSTFTPTAIPTKTPLPPALTFPPTPTCESNKVWNGYQCVCPPDKSEWLGGQCLPKEKPEKGGSKPPYP